MSRSDLEIRDLRGWQGQPSNVGAAAHVNKRVVGGENSTLVHIAVMLTVPDCLAEIPMVHE